MSYALDLEQSLKNDTELAVVKLSSSLVRIIGNAFPIDNEVLHTEMLGPSIPNYHTSLLIRLLRLSEPDLSCICTAIIQVTKELRRQMKHSLRLGPNNVQTIGNCWDQAGAFVDRIIGHMLSYIIGLNNPIRQFTQYWLDQMESSQELYREITAANSYSYTDADIAIMVAESSRFHAWVSVMVKDRMPGYQWTLT